MDRISLGRVTGKSAYELAVEDGFIGTLSEWVTSLKGERGETVIDGIPIERVINEMKMKIADLESRLNIGDGNEGGGNEVPPTDTETILATWVGGVS